MMLAILNYAVTTSNPTQVVQTAEQTSGSIFWILYVIGNILVFVFTRKAKKEANKTKQEIVSMFEAKGGQE